MKKSVFAVFPTLLTLGNLFCGFAGIFLLVSAREVLQLPGGGVDPVLLAAWLVFLAMGFDAVDGHVARLTRRTGAFGMQLDSLADLVSFGVVPGCLIFFAVGSISRAEGALVYSTPLAQHFTLIIGAVFLACVALRLARFNVEHSRRASKETHGNFRGLPAPAAAGLIAALVIFDRHLAGTPGLTTGPILAAPFLAPLLSLLMISRMPYLHLGERYLRQRKSFDNLLPIVVLLMAGVVLYWLTPLLLLGWYAASGPLDYLRRWFYGAPAGAPETDESK